MSDYATGHTAADLCTNASFDVAATSISPMFHHTPCGLYGCQFCWPFAQTVPIHVYWPNPVTYTVYWPPQPTKPLAEQIRDIREKMREYKEAKDELKSLIRELQDLLKEGGK